MLKRSLIALILAVACLLSGCRKLSDNEKIPTENDTNKPVSVVPSKPQDLIGKWYSEKSAIVFEFLTNNTVTLYELTLGYYEYDIAEAGTYTYDGTTLKLKFPSTESEIVFTCSVDKSAMSMTESFSTFEFTPVTDLPTAHPTYTFPNFETIAQTNPLPSDNYTGLAIETDITKESILTQLTAEYWLYILSSDSKKFDDLTKLESGVAKEGDFVNINYEGKVDGVPFDGGTAENQIICVMEGTGYVDGFCIGVLDQVVGTTFDVPVKFPENYHADLAGKDAVFTMTLNYIYDGTVLTDEVAIEQKQESLEAWIDTIYDEQMLNKIWDLIPGLKDITVPADAYNFFHQYYMDTIHEAAFYNYNNDYNKALIAYGHTEESLLEYSKNNARSYLLGAQIAALFDLSPSEELTQVVLEEYMELYSLTEAKAKEDIEGSGKNEFRARLLRQLAAEYLLENNTFILTNE